MRTKTRSLLLIFPILTATVFLLPITVGLIGTWLPAFDFFPALNHSSFSIQPFKQLFSTAGFTSALALSLTTGVLASIISLLLTVIIFIGLYPSKLFTAIENTLAPILSIPHAAFAIGLGFLITPSGWIIRLIHFFTGAFDQPPTWSTFQDPHGFSLIFTLVLKEAPFLIFIALGILPSLKIDKTLWLGKSMGYSTRFSWLWLIFPQLYKQIRLPFFAVLAYSMTVVDIAIISGPTTPPTLAVFVTRLFNDPNLINRLYASAGATILLFSVILILVMFWILEKLFKKFRSFILYRGNRFSIQGWETSFAITTLIAFVLFYTATFWITLIWSFSQRWRFPSLLPTETSLRFWLKGIDRLPLPLLNTFSLATLSTAIAIILCIGALENEVRLKYQRNSVINVEKLLWWIYIPLVIPQVAFLFGFQVTLIRFGLDANYWALLWSHLVFVIPYVFLTLSGPYRRFDDRYYWVALSLSNNRWHSFWNIKLKLLLRPVGYAFATGFSVSTAQYLPTIFIGAGKYSTITTEAVAMASGSDRRMMAVLAMWQQFLPLLIFSLALIIPTYLFRHRQLMKNN